MTLKNKLLFLTILNTTFLLNSCGAIIDTSDSSCSKMSETSSIPISELLKSPEYINIDNKEFRLNVGMATPAYMPTVKTFFPKFEHHCYQSASGFIMSDNSIAENITGVALSPDSLERIWFINSENKIWESNKLNFSSDEKTDFKVEGVNFKSAGNGNLKIFLKFKYKENSYIIKASM